MVKVTAPFKRGTKLVYTCRKHGEQTLVTYVKWLGLERSSLIVVCWPDKTKSIVHVDDVQVPVI
jgi:hypothetical protein